MLGRLDAQALINYGFNVDCYDTQTLCSEYLKWRIYRDLRQQIDVRDIYAPEISRYDLVYSVDVIEHAMDPSALLRALQTAGDYICINLFTHSVDAHVSEGLHYPLNHWELFPIMDETHQLIQVASSAETVVTLWKSRDR